ncbi:MAG: hypothetical protein IPO51_06440 [Dehalococcoidia bacterium]|nr:hypothetical protein [Dehalococcoidia bacterium]
MPSDVFSSSGGKAWNMASTSASCSFDTFSSSSNSCGRSGSGESVRTRSSTPGRSTSLIAPSMNVSISLTCIQTSP